MSLKKHIKDLLLQLGASDNQAEYDMLCAAEEWPALDGVVTRMMKEG